MKKLKKLSIISFLLLLVSNGYALQKDFSGNNNILEKQITIWKNQNPKTIITKATSIDQEEIITRNNNPQKVKTTKGLKLNYIKSKWSKSSVPKKLIFGVDYLAPGVVFVRGAGNILKERVKKWTKTNPQAHITALEIETFTDDIWTSEGYVKKLVARGMWIFYRNKPTLKKISVKSKNIKYLGNNLFFIKGPYTDYLQKKYLSNILINDSSNEHYTDHVWNGKSYSRREIIRGKWLAYNIKPAPKIKKTSNPSVITKNMVQAKPTNNIITLELKEDTQATLDIIEEQRPTISAKEPFNVAEEYFKEALDHKDVTYNNNFSNYLSDASYWYNIIIEDFDEGKYLSTAKLRLLEIDLLNNINVTKNKISEIFSQHEPQNLEENVLFELLPYYKEKNDYITQLLLYQRIIQANKNNPYSKASFDAIKEIEKLNKKIHEQL